jgi:hypothetical protein
MRAVLRKLKPAILPVLRCGVHFAPVGWKFRRIAGGFEARRWYRQVLRIGV